MQVFWLALYLPRLPLDAQLQQLTPSAADAACVVVENGRALCCSDAARAAGVRPGMKTALVRSLLPDVKLFARDEKRESALLERLACRAGSFTPHVCLLPDGLLLEIGSCLKLFGGFKSLRRQFIEGLGAQGLKVWRHAAAPVALGAAWLAKAAVEDGIKVADQERLTDALDRLELAALSDALPAGSAARLASFGLSRLGEVRRLPGAALGRRVGPETLSLMDRAYGRRADLFEAFVFPESFALKIELPSAVENAGALLFAGQRLVQALAGWLCARQAAISECHFVMNHPPPLAPTRLPLRFSAPLRDAERIVAILGERLAQLALVAPVESLHLVADAIIDCPGQSRSLFAKEGSCSEGIAALVDRLSARLGEDAVCSLAVRADHRPEAASVAAPPQPSLPRSKAKPASQADTLHPTRPTRPLWLLEPAQALVERDGKPQHKGPLVLIKGPERIESGWWDSAEEAGGGDVRRDYYVALDREQRWLWIYRDWREPGGWFLHGYFS
jgi:protein ImuB